MANSSAEPAPAARGHVYRWIAYVACGVDAIFAVLLAVAGAGLVAGSRPGLASAAGRAQFATGMLLTSAGWLAIVVSAAFVLHATWCWRSLRPRAARGAVGSLRVSLALALPVLALTAGLSLAWRLSEA